jgi:plastocyanin
MERIHTKTQTQTFAKLAAFFFAALLASALMPRAEAGTVLAKPEAELKLAPGESYPESRFGKKPNFAARETAEMETSDEQGGSRSPAGLVFKETGPANDSAEKGPGIRVDEMGRGREARTAARFESAESRPVKPDADSIEPASAIARKGVQEVALIAGDLGFFPKTVFVNRDIPVRLFVTGASKNTLCLMMDSFQVRKQVRSQKIEEITFTPNMPGKYRFYCPVGGMEGTLIVKELATSVASTNEGRSPAGEGSVLGVSDRTPSSAAVPVPAPGVREE